MSQATARIAILCSFNLELFRPRLIRSLGALGVDADCHVAPYGQHFISALDRSSSLYGFDPSVVIVYVDAMDLLADFIASPFDLDAAQLEDRVDAAFVELRSALTAIRGNLPAASIFLNNFCALGSPATGFLDASLESSVAAAVSELNERLSELRADVGAIIVDYAGFLRRHGWENVWDPRLWYHSRMRLGLGALDRLADLYAGYVYALLGLTKKCLVCDLDGALWGGVVGEMGHDGIELSEDGVGRAHKDFQREILNLKKQGVLLAINSKNNLDDVVEVFERHPDMVLRLEDFESVQINWDDKVSNMHAIARELNIGLDSMVFIDDSSFECDLVRHALPRVTVVQLPTDPAQHPEFLRSLPWFRRLKISEEDSLRSLMMAQQRTRQREQASFANHEEFLYSLGMVAEVSRVTPMTIGRATQLTQKTNQFNLTTRRYTEDQMAALVKDDCYLTLLVRLKDKLGDSGIVGLAIIETGAVEWRLDTFLLSCRVLGRGLETAFLSYILGQAQRRSVRRLLAEFIQTNRNQPAADFLPSHGFQNYGGGAGWELDVAAGKIQPPSWISVAEQAS
jgi:FkbH-like protein